MFMSQKSREQVRAEAANSSLAQIALALNGGF